ncbi:MAG: hypothetical protein WKF71_12715 [Pyrinomonadaceae bacterium]
MRIPLKLLPTQAKAVKTNLAVAYITKLVAPYWTVGSTEIKPTIDKPDDIKSYHYYLIGNVSEIWLLQQCGWNYLLKAKT